jgi:ribonuclease P protein component
LIDRIRHRDAFDRLRREGIRVRVDSLWCSYVPDSAVAPPRVAFAIGRATGSAVQRNRLRRRLRAILGACDVPAGLLLIGADRAATEHTFGELEHSVRRLLATMQRRAAAVSV